MLKTEIICDSCNNHYIVVTEDEVYPGYCPLCSSPILEEEDLDIGDDS